MQTQEIESWIKEERSKYSGFVTDGEAYQFKRGYYEGANLLLPEIKLRDEKIATLKSEIDRLKEENEKLEKDRDYWYKRFSSAELVIVKNDLHIP